MPKLVQFTHPGKEHKPDKDNKKHKSWNQGDHRRKFLNASGKFVQKNQLIEDSLIFWGEWEPPSTVQRLDAQENEFMPEWLHKPYLPAALPIATTYQKSYQNTDPLVFGNNFKYFVCKQFRPKSKKETALARLEKGSLILFGSTGNQNKKNAFFQLDTVFVVADYIPYDPSDTNALRGSQLDKYKDIVYKMAFPKPLDYSLKLRLYIGATYDNPIHGMYSFTPARVYKNHNYGFPRIALKDLNYITNNLNAAPKISEVGQRDIVEFWKTIRNISREQGCVEGVEFNIPPKK